MSKRARFAEAYRMMAELGYRPMAPSDGYGHLTVPTADLDLAAEAREYAERFEAEEDTNSYWAGCTDYSSNRAAILALEAFRAMNAGLAVHPKLVPALLRKAAEEYERERRESATTDALLGWTDTNGSTRPRR